MRLPFRRLEYSQKQIDGVLPVCICEIRDTLTGTAELKFLQAAAYLLDFLLTDPARMS